MSLRSRPIVTAILHAFVASAIFLAPCLQAATVPTSMTSADWDGEFSDLLAGLARNYANFEDAVRVRKVDMAGAAARGRIAITSSTDDQGRKDAFDQFLRDLGDPHLFIEWSPGDGVASQVACPTSLVRTAARPGVGFDRLPNFVQLDSAEGRMFRAGLLRLNASRAVGVIRIPIFIARAFPAACTAAVAHAGIRADTVCNDACSMRIEGIAGRIMDTALVATVRELENAGATELLVDVTHNDGGTDWSEVVARILGGPVRSARIGMLKHPAWRGHIDERLTLLKGEARKHRGASQIAYERVIADMVAARSSLDQECDFSGAWQGAPPSCTTIVVGGIHATGVFDNDEDAPVGVVAELYSPSLYAPYPIQITRLPMIVLIDRDTHSSAEQFAAVLQDNGRAAVMGVVSAGAGCGTFTDRGSSFRLPRSQARVHVPDCVRFRADGSSERRGVMPDQIIPWGPSDSRYEIALKAATALTQRRRLPGDQPFPEVKAR